MKKFIKCMAALIACIQLVTIPAYALGGEDYTPSYWGTLINQVQFAQIAPGVTEQQLTLLVSGGDAAPVPEGVARPVAGDAEMVVGLPG